MSVNTDVYSDVSDSDESGVYWCPLETLYQLSAIGDRRNRRHKISVPTAIFFSMPSTEAPQLQPQQSQQGGRKAGATNYSKEEVHHLLDILEDIFPIGPDEWNCMLMINCAESLLSVGGGV